MYGRERELSGIFAEDGTAKRLSSPSRRNFISELPLIEEPLDIVSIIGSAVSLGLFLDITIRDYFKSTKPNKPEVITDKSPQEITDANLPLASPGAAIANIFPILE